MDLLGFKLNFINTEKWRFRSEQYLGKPRYLTVYAYITSEFLISFLICFLFFFFIFFINQLLLMAEEILSKRVPFKYVALLIIYSLPSIIALAFPFATLVGALMAFGRFSTDNEIIALKSSGVSQHRIFLPLVVIGLLFSLFSFVMNDYFLPLGRINFLKLYKRLIAMNPEMELEPFSIKQYQDSTIIIGDVVDKEILSITIIRKENDSKKVIQAESARIVDMYENEGIISLELHDVFSHTYQYRNRDQYDFMTAETMIYNILLKDISFSLQNPGPAEMRSLDVRKVILEKKEIFVQKKKQHLATILEMSHKTDLNYYAFAEGISTSNDQIDLIKNDFQNLNQLRERVIEDRNLQTWKLEYFQKFSIPFSCIPFIFLAFPLGLMTRKSGRAVGFGIGLLLTVVYWSLLVVGRTLGLRAGYPPFITMWVPNILIAVLGILLYFNRIKK